MLDYKEHYHQALRAWHVRQRNCPTTRCQQVRRQRLSKTFEACERLSYPLEEGITNYGIAEIVYGRITEAGFWNPSIELPDFQDEDQYK